jgi:dipeptidyl aminopeptidase/acylaminoacyl peptidase
VPSNFSPDGSKVLLQSNLSGTAQLYVTAAGGGPLRAVTDLAEPAAGAYLPTDDDIVVATSAGGAEHTQLYRTHDDGTGFEPLLVDPEHIHRLGGVTRDGRLLAVATNSRTGADFDIYVVPLADPSARRMVFDRGGWLHPRGFSPDGRWLAVSRMTERSGDDELFLVEVTTGEVIEVAPHEAPVRLGAPAWRADSEGFFFSTDADRDRRAIARFDLDRRSWRYVLERDRDADADCTMDWPGTQLLVETETDGCTTAELVDPVSLETRQTVPLPGRGSASFGFSRDGTALAYSFTSACEPGDAWLYQCCTGTTTRLTTMPRGVDAEDLVDPDVVRITSFDREEISLFVYRHPEAAGSTPVVVYLHGGPESHHGPGYDPLVQYLAATGYAVVAPNVRGSTGYGKRFEHLDDGRRRLDAVADLVAVHDWLATQPGLDHRRAALFGGSYGGYLVEAGLAFQPERWAAGVSVVGISSLVTFLQNTASFRRKVREAEYGSLDDDADFLRHASPLTHADRIRAPLLLLHGANDPRVPVEEARQLQARLRDQGNECDLIVYPDEGHGLAKQSNRLDAYRRTAEFLARVLRPGTTQ